MNRIMIAAAALGASLSLVACQPAPVGVRDVEVPSDSANQCASLCGHVGLRLQSLVIMANNVGCVCAPDEVSRPSDTSAAASSAGGMAAIMVAEEAARQQQQHNQRQQQQQSYQKR